MKQRAYTVFQGRAGDRNDLAMAGAMAIGRALAQKTGIHTTVIGTPAPALGKSWQEELEAAMPDLAAMRDRLDDVLASGAVSVAATSRCTVSLATLPVVVRHRPSACIVWFDAHGDLNTPTSTTTGYLGGLVLTAPAGLWDSGLGDGLDLDQIVLVGQRELDPFEQELIDGHGVAHVRPGAGLESELRRAVAGRPVYMHLDCDVLNPGIVPTEYAPDGGLSLEELNACCRVIAEHELVGIEIAEFQNVWHPHGEPVSPEPLLDALAPVLAL